MTDIRFTAQVFKVQTLVDGGYRITLDAVVPNTTLDAIMKLMECSKPGVILELAAVPIEKQYNNNDVESDKDAIQTRTIGKSTWETSKKEGAD